MPSTTPQKPPASAKILELNVSPTNHMATMASTNTGSAAICARPHGTLTLRLQPVQRRLLLGPSVCFCQNENVLRSHHGHAYIEVSLTAAHWRLLGVILDPVTALFQQAMPD